MLCIIAEEDVDQDVLKDMVLAGEVFGCNAMYKTNPYSAKRTSRPYNCRVWQVSILPSAKKERMVNEVMA